MRIRRRAARLPSRCSCSSYVATTPRRSRALATRLTRAAKRVRLRCIGRKPYRQRRLVFTVTRWSVYGVPVALKIFYAYRDAPERRAALAAARGAPERYRLFGRDELEERGATIRHNLERSRPPLWARSASPADQRRSLPAGWLRRRLRVDPVLAAGDQPERHRALDCRHGRNSSGAARTRWSRAHADRVHGSRPAGAARAVAGGADAAPVQARARRHSRGCLLCRRRVGPATCLARHRSTRSVRPVRRRRERVSTVERRA